MNKGGVGACYVEDSLNTVYEHYILCISGSICLVKEEKYCMNPDKPYDSDRHNKQEGIRRSLLCRVNGHV